MDTSTGIYVKNGSRQYIRYSASYKNEGKSILVGPPPMNLSENKGGGLLHIQVTLPTNELPCSYITVTLYNI
jgi:hypothetical protein